MNDQDIGRNIQEARYKRGLNQAQLGDAIALDRTAISRIENGTRAVTASELTRMVEILGVDVADVLKPAPDLPRLATTTRLLMRAGAVDPDDFPQLQWFLDIYSRLAKIVGQGDMEPLEPRILRLPPSQGGELAARRLRSRLGLNPEEPVRRLSEVANKLRLFVVAARLPSRSRVAGCLVMADGSPGAVLVNSNHPPARQRFTLAHEIGHSVLDNEGRARACDTTGSPRPGPRPVDELRADVFASSFLLPKRAVDSFVAKAPVSYDRISSLEEDYGVSHAATLSRLRALRAISDAEARVLRKMAPPLTHDQSPPPFRRVSETIAHLLTDEYGPEAGGPWGEVVPDAEVVP